MDGHFASVIRTANQLLLTIGAAVLLHPAWALPSPSRIVVIILDE